MIKTILGISGSLRAASFNTRLLQAAAGLLPSGVELQFADIGALPLYNGDLDGPERPRGVEALVGAIQAADALLIATPEYNYSVSGVLKNAIDWASRPAFQSSLAHRPTAIVGASLSPIGTARAQSHLRQILAGTLTPVYPHPDLLIGQASNKFDNAGSLTDADTRERLQKYLGGFVAWAERQAGAAGR